MHRKEYRGRRISAKVLAAVLTAAMMISAAPATFAQETQTEADTELVLSEDSDKDESKDEDSGGSNEEDSGDADDDAEYPQLETTGGKDAKVTAIDVSGIVEECMPSIVTISEKSVQEVEDYFGEVHSVEEEGAASGFIIAQNKDELLIATNNHVVNNATDVTVAFSVDADNDDDKVVPAKVKGTDPSTDLAVVAVKLSDIKEDVLKQLKIAVLGSSDDLKVGQTAITIGNTLGEGLTVTSGIVAALNCTVETDEGTFTEFQTDGAANMGQSGGAVLNAKGEVIGIFNAGYLEADNIGYAVPISTAIPVLQGLINRKTRDALDDYGYLGIMVAPVTDDASDIYNIPKGAFVASVEEDSAAGKAGIQKGDVITKFDGLTIDSRDTLLKQIQYYAPGETVEITYKRAEGGNEYKEHTVSVTLAEATDEVKKARQGQNASSDTQDEADSSDNSGADKDGGEDKDSIENRDGGGSDDSGDLVVPWGDIFGGQGGNAYGPQDGNSQGRQGDF